ncbi:MAG: hypothetical protein NTX91_04335 [candidate division SR1 bacterium]|nr:hypothetical protein [candidate division SR1 bacterium]
MKTFQTFFIKSHTWNPETLQASFLFSFDNEVEFTETINFTCEEFTPIQNADPAIISNLLFHLSLAIGISYYKLCPTKEIIVENGYLNDEQKKFRNQFYINGLGEYFFKNEISPKGLCQFVNSKEAADFSFLGKQFTPTRQQIMVAIGGGKDSLVSVELVKKLGLPFYTSTFGKDYALHQMVSKKIDAARLVMQRTMDEKLFEMNEAGYYNGHVPISGIIAFVLVTAAYLYDYNFIVMSNEKSASEGNTIMDGIEINHQRSKSLDFELAFAEYLQHAITNDVTYFSLLRGMYEIKIAELFAQYPQYFDVFSSCNTNFKILEESLTKIGLKAKNNFRRCNSCPKCAFVYAILRPFVTADQAKTIWGEELYEKESLLTTFRALLGIEGIKPFECVGTNEEVVLGMKKSLDMWKGDLPVILEMFAREIGAQMKHEDWVALEEKLFTISDEGNIPGLFHPLLSSL